jgi:hypothetical protein
MFWAIVLEGTLFGAGLTACTSDDPEAGPDDKSQTEDADTDTDTDTDTDADTDADTDTDTSSSAECPEECDANAHSIADAMETWDDCSPAGTVCCWVVTECCDPCCPE